MELKIDPIFKNLISPLSNEEFELLEQSCLAEGIRDAIVTWNGFIIDGHNRYIIAKKHALEFQTVEKNMPTNTDVIDWMINNQLGKRNISEEQKSYLRGKRYENEKNKHGTNQHTGRSGHSDHSTKTSETLADELNVSEKTIRRDAQFAIGVDALSEDERKQVLQGKSDLTKKEVQSIGKTKTEAKRDVEKKSFFITEEEKELEIARRAEELAAKKLAEIKAQKQRKREEKKAIQEAQELDILSKMNSEADTPMPQYGQWVQLGRHWLYCGDNQDEAFKLKLPQSDFVFADPPYNAGVEEWDNDFVWDLDWLMDYAPTVVVTPGIISIPDLFKNTEMPYRWSMACFITNGMTRGALGFGNWIYLPVFSKLQTLHKNSQDIVKVSISPDSEHYHKGRKPIKLIQTLLTLFCNHIVIDPFLGSGTTLFAAEVMGKTCYGAEKDLSYCQKIISSFECRKHEDNFREG